MKWLTLAGILLYLSRYGDAGALKCSPKSQDPSCAPEKRDSSPSRSPSPDAECQPGSEWDSNCHYCRCSESGVAECLKQDFCDLQVFDEPIRCKPNTTFQRSCNTCTCLENGLGLCTLMGCIDFPIPDTTDRRKRQAVQSESKDCEPGSRWNVECNTCFCTSNGIAACTRKGCLGPNLKLKKRETSGPESTTKSSNITKRVVCVANRMFIMDCNTCWCNEDGTSFFCTRKICTPDSEENTTEDLAEVRLRVVQKECRPNEVFQLDCNMCRCNADGKSFSCTRRACVEVDDKNASATRKTRAVQEAQKTCQPGSEFRMDCNKCLCNSEGQDFSCTRIDCAAQNGNGAVDSFAGTRSKRDVSEKVQMQCEAGNVFDRDCNVCRCTDEGLHAICTTKRCKVDKPEPTTEPSQGFRCTPGDQFKKECNDCTCSADGRSYFCTLRLCDEELVP